MRITTPVCKGYYTVCQWYNAHILPSIPITLPLLCCSPLHKPMPLPYPTPPPLPSPPYPLITHSLLPSHLALLMSSPVKSPISVAARLSYRESTETSGGNWTLSLSGSDNSYQPITIYTGQLSACVRPFVL